MSHALALAASRRHACAEDIELIWEVMENVEPKRTVILGAGSGTMSLAWLERRAPEWTLLSVDHNIEAIHWEQAAWRNAGHCAGEPPRTPAGVSQLHMDAARAAEWNFSHQVNLLIADTAHTFAQTYRELDAWLPHVPVGGAVILHDYDAVDAPHLYPGVREAADEHLINPPWLLYVRHGWSSAWTRDADD